MASLFVYNYAGVGEYMRTDADLASALHDRAVLALEFAKSISPVGTPQEHDHHPGHYRESFELTGPRIGRDRMGYELGNTADYAPAVEAGHHVLAATVAALGDPRGGEGL